MDHRACAFEIKIKDFRGKKPLSKRRLVNDPAAPPPLQLCRGRSRPRTRARARRKGLSQYVSRFDAYSRL